MRLALVFDDRARPDTTGVHCRDALEELCEVRHFRPDELSRLATHGFDLYLNIDDGLRYRFPPTLRPSAWWVIDTHLSYDCDRAKAEDFDYVFAAQRDGAQRLRADGVPNVEWLPLACNARFHRHHDTDKAHDVCFIGALIPGERKRLVELLQEEFERVFVGRAYWEEMAQEYSRARIVFNRSILNDVNMRVFEAVACGSLLVTNDLADNGLEELLRNGEHLVTYRDDRELLERVRYYLEHEDEREAIARRGMEEAHAKHTYRHRMQRILEVMARLPSRGRTATEQRAPQYYQFPRPDLIALIPCEARIILDVGCGAGRMGEALKRRQPARVVGVEVVPEVAEEARQRLDEVIVGDVEALELPFPEAHFDCIVCGDILEHLRNPRAALRKLVRHLRVDGRLVASIPNVRNAQVICDLMAGRWQYRPAGILDEGHLRFFTLAEIRELFRSCGLIITGIQRVFDPQHQQWAAAGRPPNLQLGALGFQARSPRDAEELFVEQYLVTARPCAHAPAPGAASIIIPVWNQLEHTELCLESVQRHTAPNHEVIVIDNGSDDETPSYLAALDWVKVIRNEQNEGFVKACNQGIEAAAGDYLVLLNNDTIVTDGWLSGLIAVAGQDDNIGMVGPVSNNVSGPQQIPTDYRTVAEMHKWAEAYTQSHAGHVAETGRLVGFCLLIKREVLEYIGLLDERYGLGLFDDDDLCLRARRAGYRLVYTPGVFVHHFGSRTLATLGVDAEVMLHENWRRFRAKWEGEPGGAEELARLYPSIAERVPKPADRQRASTGTEESDRPAPRRIAVVSLLFNWPSMGGGNMDTAGLVRALGAAEHEVAHFYARIPAIGVGNVSHELGTPSHAVELGSSLPSRSQVEEAFRQAVAGFAPDVVVITDSWTCKPFLARALSEHPYVLRFQALEALCPLNGARFIVQGGEIELCRDHLLLDATKCAQCLQVHQSKCGPLHVAERTISGADAGQAYVSVLREALANAIGVLVYNPLLAAGLAPHSPLVRVATPGVNLERLQRAAPLGDPARKVVLLPSLWTEGLKGYHVLAEACRRLREQRDDFELRVAGPDAGPINEWTTCVGWYPQDR
ncbi:MAG: glycosyltransferase, partial [Armatimonadetes bacterium]|nr:glycosyltransferase [Armatimonadota bacterium]